MSLQEVLQVCHYILTIHRYSVNQFHQKTPIAYDGNRIWLHDRGPTVGILKKQLGDQFAVQLTENS